MADASPATTCTAAHPEHPTRSARLLSLVRRLIDHGRQFVATLRQAAAPTGHDTFNRGLRSRFGTLDIALIIARITRGLCLAAALEDRIAASASRLDRPRPVPAAPPQPRPVAPRAHAPHAERPSIPDLRDDATLVRLPTPEEIAAAVRRRPIGAVIADICRDLGIMPADPLWSELNQAILFNRGNAFRLFKDILERGRLTRFFPPDTPLIPPMPPGWRAPSRSFTLATPSGTGPPG